MIRASWDRCVSGPHRYGWVSVAAQPMDDAMVVHVPCRDFRNRVGAEAIEATGASVVELFRTLGLSQGELLSTNGQIERLLSRTLGGPALVQFDGER